MAALVAAGFAKRAGIGNGNQDGITLLPDAQAHETASLTAGHAMFDGILHQGLDGQDGYFDLQERIVDIEFRA